MTPFVGSAEVCAAMGCSIAEAEVHLRAAAALCPSAPPSTRIPLYVWEHYIRTLYPDPAAGGRARRPRIGAVLLSKREAARRLGVDRNGTLNTLIASGQLRAVPKNGQQAIPTAEVERLAREGFDVHHRRGTRKRHRAPESVKPVAEWKLKL